MTSPIPRNARHGERGMSEPRYRPAVDVVAKCEVEGCGTPARVLRLSHVIVTDFGQWQFCSWRCVSMYAIKRELTP